MNVEHAGDVFAKVDAFGSCSAAAVDSEMHHYRWYGSFASALDDAGVDGWGKVKKRRAMSYHQDSQESQLGAGIDDSSSVIFEVAS